MNNVGPIASPSAAGALSPGQAVRRGEPAAATDRGSDRVELSYASQLLSKLAELPEVRQELIDQVRGEIAAGTYDTPEKIDTLLDKLAEDLG